jgi:hypothetical protein
MHIDEGKWRTYLYSTSISNPVTSLVFEMHIKHYETYRNRTVQEGPISLCVFLLFIYGKRTIRTKKIITII